MVQAATPFEQHAGTLRREIDAALAACLNFSPGCPKPLAKAIDYSLLAPGKRLRPLLTLLAAESCGASRSLAMPAACAVEMIHAYSLIHDDLPAMDNDDLRRGRPTCHKQFGEALAILAGDALQAMAFEILATQVRPVAVAARCCAALAFAAGPTALVGGQADDLGEQFAEPDLATLESIHARKTGAMLNVSLELGALCAGADKAAHEALSSYGQRLGLAFQITDDLLDVRGDEVAVGKRVGKDAERGKQTFPQVLGIDASVERATRLVREACDALKPLGERAQPLADLACYVLERDR